MNAKKLKGLIKKNPEPARGRFGINPMDPWSAKYGIAEATDKNDTVILNIPLLIRVLELAREDIKTDMDLHRVVEKLINIRKKGVLTMKDYNTIAHIKENHIAIAMGRMLDDEGSMVLDQLDQLQRACNMIRTYVGKDTTKQLPAWVQSKITLATDYVDTAGNYLSSKNEKVTEAVMKCKDNKLHETKSCGCYKEEMVNEVSKKKLYDYMLKAGSRDDPKKDTKDRGMNVVKASEKYYGKVKKEEVLDELNYDTVKKLYKDRRADFHGAQVGKKKKGKEVSAKNVSTTISRLMGYKPTQNQPKKEEVEQIDELNYDTVNTYDKERKANPSSKKSPEVVLKNRTASVNRFMGKTRTQNSPMQGVKRELTPQQKTLQKDYHDSQRRGMSTEEVVNEQDPCWTGYTQVGMKKKGGRQVPNCVPSKGVPKAKGYKEEVVNELSNKLLGKYKKEAGEKASAADKAGDFKTGNKRFSGIVKATKKQFDNATKKQFDNATKKQFDNGVKEGIFDFTKMTPAKDRMSPKASIKAIATGSSKSLVHHVKTINGTTGKYKSQGAAIQAAKQINDKFPHMKAAVHSVTEETRSKELTKSARMIKALYKRKNVKEETYDWEKEDKSVQTYGKKPTVQMTDKKNSYGEEKPKAAITMTGGTTLTGTKRDDVQIDPMMNKRAGPANTFPGNYGKNS